MGNEEEESELPGQSRVIGSNLSLSSHSRRQNSQSQRSITGGSSEEYILQESTIEVIGPTNPANTVSSSGAMGMGRYSMTQPTDDGGIYRGGEVGGSVRYPPSSRDYTTSGPTTAGYFGSGAATQLEPGHEMYFEGTEDLVAGPFKRSVSLSPRHMLPPPGVYNRFGPATRADAPSMMSYRGSSHSQTLLSHDLGMSQPEEQKAAKSSLSGSRDLDKVMSEEDLPVEWEVSNCT